MDSNENYSCVDCIWHDQCESDVPCDFFDRGLSGVALTDSEIQNEQERQKYYLEYQEYIKECGG